MCLSFPFPASLSLSYFGPHAVCVHLCELHAFELAARIEGIAGDECAKNKEFISIGASVEIESRKVDVRGGETMRSVYDERANSSVIEFSSNIYYTHQ